MAIRKPLIAINGSISELPAGDSIIAGVNIPVESATLSILLPSLSHEQEIFRPGTLATQTAIAWFASVPPSEENGPDWLEGVIINSACNADAVVFYLSAITPEQGNIKINYQVF
jgi:hypothetical protein